MSTNVRRYALNFPGTLEFEGPALQSSLGYDQNKKIIGEAKLIILVIRLHSSLMTLRIKLLWS